MRRADWLWGAFKSKFCFLSQDYKPTESLADSLFNYRNDQDLK